MANRTAGALSHHGEILQEKAQHADGQALLVARRLLEFPLKLAHDGLVSIILIVLELCARLGRLQLNLGVRLDLRLQPASPVHMVCKRNQRYHNGEAAEHGVWHSVLRRSDEVLKDYSVRG